MSLTSRLNPRVADEAIVARRWQRIVSRWQRQLQSWISRSRTESESIGHLDDRMLRDIGLERSQPSARFPRKRTRSSRSAR